MGSNDPFAAYDDMQRRFGPGSDKKDEKGLAWRAKVIDDKMYLPLEQVIELLAQNDVLPKVRRGLEKHLPKKETS